MAIIEIKERLGERGSGTRLERGSPIPIRTAKRIFLVRTNSKADGAVTVERAIIMDGETVVAAVPRVGQAHPESTALNVEGVEARQISDEGTVWEVEVTYSSMAAGTGGGGTDWEDPLQRPPTIQWDGMFYSEEVYEDINGDPIVNSAGDPFDPTVEEEYPVRILTIGVNKAEYDDNAYAGLFNTVNDAEFAGVPAGELRFVNASASLQYEGATSYWAVTFTFQRKPGGWDRRIVDRGFHYLDGGDRKRILDADGDPVSQPVLLNGSGGVVAPGGDAWLLEFVTKGSTSFAALGIFPAPPEA